MFCLQNANQSRTEMVAGWLWLRDVWAGGKFFVVASVIKKEWQQYNEKSKLHNSCRDSYVCNILQHHHTLEFPWVLLCTVFRDQIFGLETQGNEVLQISILELPCFENRHRHGSGLGRVNSYQQSTRGDPRVPHITHPWWRRLLGSTSSHLMTATNTKYQWQSCMGDTYDVHMRANCDSSNVCGRLPYFTKLSFWVSRCFRLYHAVRFF